MNVASDGTATEIGSSLSSSVQSMPTSKKRKAVLFLAVHTALITVPTILDGWQRKSLGLKTAFLVEGEHDWYRVLTTGLVLGLWWYRIAWRRDPSIIGDVAVLFALEGAIGGRRLLERIIDEKDFNVNWHDSLKRVAQTLMTGRGILTLATGIFWLFVWRTISSRSGFHGPTTSTLTSDPFEGPLKPLLFPCRMTHTRMFPKKHSFGYSYLLVGVPVGFRGTMGSLVSVDSQLLPRHIQGKGQAKSSAWFEVRGGDYLGRGGEDMDLRGKLSQYLRSEGVGDEEWKYAYLVTAARFLGYSFNPVSFWYVYSGDLELRFMVLEVNNTFGERRMYLLKGSGDHDAGDQEGGADGNGNGVAKGSDKTTTKKFTDAWAKDFHVSPFNSRKGSYALTAHNPFVPLSQPSTSPPRIDNTITLKSSKAHGKLVARIFSTSDAINPASLGFGGKAKFLLSWWWVGFVTFPRILREAGRLFWKRRLHVWLRPEVLKGSVGRDGTGVEEFVAPLLEDYIRSLVQSYKSDRRITVNLISPLPSCPSISVNSAPSISPSDRRTSNTHRNIDITILTPAFYSRFLHYSSLQEAIEAEFLNTDIKNRTVEISNVGLLLEIICSSSSSSLDSTATSEPTSIPGTKGQPNLIAWRWSLLSKIQSFVPPPAVAYDPAVGVDGKLYPSFSRQAAGVQSSENKGVESPEEERLIPSTSARPALQPSTFDTFILKNYHQNSGNRSSTKGLAELYRRIATKYFIATYLFLGFDVIIDILDFCVRAGLIWMYISRNSTSHGVHVGSSGEGVGDKASLVEVAAIGMAVHLWELLKGW